MDKFLIATNPNRTTDELYIVHAIRPVLLISVLPHTPATDVMLSIPETAYIEVSRTGKEPEKWVLVPVNYFKEGPLAVEVEELYRGITLRAAHWFRAYRTLNPNGHAVDVKADRAIEEGRKDS